MAVKYISNTTKIAYQFQNGKLLARKGVLVADEKTLEELKKDFYFKGLVERGAILVSENKPADLDDAATQLAEKEIEIKSLKEKLEKAEAKIDEASCTTEDESAGATVIDSAEPHKFEKKGKKDK